MHTPTACVCATDMHVTYMLVGNMSLCDQHSYYISLKMFFVDVCQSRHAVTNTYLCRFKIGERYEILLNDFMLLLLAQSSMVSS